MYFRSYLSSPTDSHPRICPAGCCGPELRLPPSDKPVQTEEKKSFQRPPTRLFLALSKAVGGPLTLVSFFPYLFSRFLSIPNDLIEPSSSSSSSLRKHEVDFICIGGRFRSRVRRERALCDRFPRNSWAVRRRQRAPVLWSVVSGRMLFVLDESLTCLGRPGGYTDPANRTQFPLSNGFIVWEATHTQWTSTFMSFLPL